MKDTAECYYCGQEFDLDEGDLIPLEFETYKFICGSCI